MNMAELAELTAKIVALSKNMSTVEREMGAYGDDDYLDELIKLYKEDVTALTLCYVRIAGDEVLKLIDEVDISEKARRLAALRQKEVVR